MGPLNWASTALSAQIRTAQSAQIRKTLESAGVPFSEQVHVDGYQADFVFHTPDGHRHLVEVKPWDSTRSDLARARRLAAHLQTLPVDGSYVVLPRLPTEQVDEIPFDVRNLNIITYEVGRTNALRPKLSRRLRAVLDK
jgi:hypothetical protein